MGDETVERGDEVVGRLPSKGIRARLYDVFQRPACHYRLVAQDQETCQHTHATHPAPVGAGR